MGQADVTTILEALGGLDRRMDGFERRMDGVERRMEALEMKFEATEHRLSGKIWQTVFTVNTAMFGLVGLSLLLFRTI